ncbi:type I phosphomannose isomerase catalytic subunit [Bacillus sp. B15-48]|uniref:type I phosphomannose isomerase catalytic subunit n=1 Tax=Bacillus sp. B15-48 TaxID=1548601 RepID=UPI00193F0A33|nr:type I phosphomannose isomerase catalytic subunit [Bacillus sp. B15-48]MBM4761650.1 mannose-6-phosphate isomerase [Bacillus sp. B15-48]
MESTTDFNGTKPIKLSSTRAWRTYTGGKLLEELYGDSSAKDSHFPEEWIMSIVSARNSGREHIKDEGLSKVAAPNLDIALKDLVEGNPKTFLGEKHVDKFGEETGVLVKLIDSSERLTVQVHPDRATAQQLFNSNYGKTEAWHILGGREIDGEPPYVYLGFKPGFTREQWEHLFEVQDIAGMLNCLHKYSVKPGDTFLIEGGVPHAIGSGCFLVEIQEPTDLTIRIEKTSPSGLKIDDFMCHQGLGFEKMFDCFSYETYTREETLATWKIEPFSIGVSEVEIIGYQHTPYFSMSMMEIQHEQEIIGDGVFSGLFILSGTGTMTTEGEQQDVKTGEQFFIPAAVSRFMLKNNGEDKLKVLRLFGPEI